MKNNKIPLLSFAITFSFLILFIDVIGQVQTPRYISMTTNTNAFYEYLPVGYSAGTEKYPLLIFIGGYGENGDGSPEQLPKMLDFGPPLQISKGIFPATFFVYGQTFSYIVISPQFTKLPVPSEINDIINYAIANYRINENRIYLTGASMGGGVCWDYPGNNTIYANRIAAMVPVCGGSYATKTKANNIAAGNVHVWATHSEFDIAVPSENTVEFVHWIDSATNPPNDLAKYTFFPGTDHNAWTPTYNLNFKEDGANVYEWMLRYSRPEVLPITSLEFNALMKNDNKVLLNWRTYAGNSILGFEIQRSRSGSSFDSIGFIKNQNNSSSGNNYTSEDVSPLNGKNYYRLKILGQNNTVTFSPVRFVEFNKSNFIIVYPNPVTEVLNINTNYTLNHAQLKILDVNGKLIQYSRVSGTGTISTSIQKLLSGMYIAEITEGNLKLKVNFIKK